MKRVKHLSIILLLASTAVAGNAQTSIEGVLGSIEANNKEILAGRQLATAQKLAARSDNNLPDPSVSYTHQYGNKEGLGIQGELVASQSFDFPTVYAQRNKLARAKGEGYDLQGAELRQQILLQAKEVCLDLVWLNQQKGLLDQRLENARQLSVLYTTRLENGDANVLETNKIGLELLNARNEARLNEAARQAKLYELAALNGGIALQFTDTVYTPVDPPQSYTQLQEEALPANSRLLSLQSQRVAAGRQLGVSKQQGLPGFELGYRLNTAAGGERFNGFLVGVSIPLFANRNKVKQARAESLYADLQLESASTVVEGELLQLYNRSVALKTSIDEYREVLKSQNNLSLLNKAIQGGQISMIEYFVDISTLYQSLQNYMQLQNEYQKVMAQVYKYRL